MVDSDGDRLIIKPSPREPSSLYAITGGRGVYLSPADAQRLSDHLTNWLDEPAPADPPRPAAAGEGGAGRGVSLDGTFAAGAVVHLTVKATVDEFGDYVIVTDSGQTWAQCPSGMSCIVDVQAAPVPLPKKIGAVIRATVEGRRSLLVLADPGASDGRAWVTTSGGWRSRAHLADVQVLSEGIDTGEADR